MTYTDAALELKRLLDQLRIASEELRLNAGKYADMTASPEYRRRALSKCTRMHEYCGRIIEDMKPLGMRYSNEVGEQDLESLTGSVRP